MRLNLTYYNDTHPPPPPNPTELRTIQIFVTKRSIKQTQPEVNTTVLEERIINSTGTTVRTQNNSDPSTKRDSKKEATQIIGK